MMMRWLLSLQKKFGFTAETRLQLLQCIRQHNSHYAGHGEQDKLFGKFRDTFIQHIPAHTWNHLKKPVVKTLRDKFRAMMKARRELNKLNNAASGIAEDVTECDQLLDDIIIEKDQMNEERKKKKESESTKEEKLRESAEGIRECALKRKKDDFNTSENSSKSSKSRRILRNNDDMDEFNDMITKQLQHKRDIDERNAKVKEEQLKRLRDKWEAERVDRELCRRERETQLKFMLEVVRKMNRN